MTMWALVFTYHDSPEANRAYGLGSYEGAVEFAYGRCRGWAGDAIEWNPAEALVAIMYASVTSSDPDIQFERLCEVMAQLDTDLEMQIMELEVNP